MVHKTQQFISVDINGNILLGSSSVSSADSYLTIQNGTNSLTNIYNAPQIISSGASGDICVNLGSQTNTFYVDGQIGMHGGSHIVDSNRNNILQMWSAENPVNYIRFDNAETTYSPRIRAVGTDANIGISIESKGSGPIELGNYKFDVNQRVGVDTNNYVMTYDNVSGMISLKAHNNLGQNCLKSVRTVSCGIIPEGFHPMYYNPLTSEIIIVSP